jgi:hypothetical protein
LFDKKMLRADKTTEMQAKQKRAAGMIQRPLNMGQRSDMPLPEVAFMPLSASPMLSAADLPNGIPRPLN